MGIPRFYRWLRNRYPQIRIDLTDPNKQVPTIDNLYLDFNGMVYRCLRDHECFLKNKFDPLAIEEIYQRVVIYMMKIIEKVNPQSTLFIAFDGVAPRAKINQSRDRRFRAAQEKQKFESLLHKLGLTDQQNFQDNSISPGTKFLTDFCEYLKKRVEIMMENEWKNLNIIFSGCTVPGQGEHKIMDFLRQGKRNSIFSESTTHCIYSADADVILLSMSLAIPHVCLIREDSMKFAFGFTATTNPRKYRDPQFEYVIIDIIKEYFVGEFSECMSALKLKDVQPIMDDFILLMAFVGNDFLPTQFCFSLKESHMEHFFSSYKSYLLKTQQFINDHGVINWNLIKKLLAIAKEFQAQMLSEKIRNSRNLQQQRQKESPFIEENEGEKEDEEINNFEVVDNRITKGQEHYYKSRFGIENINKSEQFKDIIEKYIEGLEFYARYYFIGLPSWSWYYPYHYTPLITDVYDYISNNKVDVKLQQSHPYDPFLALMFMLPIESLKLLPKSIETCIKNKANPLRSPIDYYPEDFQLDKFESLGYHKRALIPFLEEEKVRQLYQTFDQKEFTEEQRQRNIKQNSVIFRWREDHMQKTSIDFDNNLEKLKKIFKKKESKVLGMRKVFPSLEIFGKYRIDGNGRIIVDRKFATSGNLTELVFFNHFLGFIEEKIMCSPGMKEQFERAYEKIGIIGSCHAYFRVKRAQIIREIDRISYIKSSREVVIPDFALFNVPKYSYIHEVHQFQMNEAYSKSEQVVILNKEHFGCIGKIEQINRKSAKIRILKFPPMVSQKIDQSTHCPKIDEQQFFTIDSICKELQLSKKVLLTILDELIVLPKANKKDDSDIYPTAFNFGLSVINTKDGLLVPHYARCQMQNENSGDSIFENIELSKSCKELLDLYVQKMGWMIDYIEGCVSEKNFMFEKGIFARNLFKDENVNLQLYREFLKLYSIKAQGYFYSVYSKVSHRNLPQIKSSPQKELTVEVPYWGMLSKRQRDIGIPALKSEPEFHDIGDRVILLNSFECGFIVGIDDHNIFVKTHAKNLMKVNFLDVFNEKWGHYLLKEEGRPWCMDVSYYSPQHYSKVADISD